MLGVDSLGVDSLGVYFGVDFVPPRNRQTAADVCINKSTFLFHPKIHPKQIPKNPPPAAQRPCHCCSCHFSLTCENDRVPSSMITAIRGRQRECVLLDGSQVQTNSNNMLGKTKIHTKSTLQRNGPKYMHACIHIYIHTYIHTYMRACMHT